MTFIVECILWFGINDQYFIVEECAHGGSQTYVFPLVFMKTPDQHIRH